MVEPPGTPVVIALGAWSLDAPRPSDAYSIAVALDDPEIQRWNPSAQTGATPHDRALAWIADRADWGSDHASWVVRDPEGRAVGAVSLHHLDHTMRTAEVGYWLAEEARGKGAASAAVDAAARYAFDALGMVRVALFHAVENDASCRLAQRCGFLLEGTSRQSYVYGDGLRHDEHLHARLADDPAPTVGPPA